MGLDLQYIYGQTPLDEEEKEQLLIPTIATRFDLDEFEQQNIEQAVQWVFAYPIKAQAIFTRQFVCRLHKRMYGSIWSWAGSFRKTDKNLGVSKWQIPAELKNLLDDARYWIAHHTYPEEEIAIRFKHRIVKIHCFPNGNGRHSRLMADIIMEKIYKLSAFSWGSENLTKCGNIRKNYINAIREADQGNYTPLMTFAKS